MEVIVSSLDQALRTWKGSPEKVHQWAEYKARVAMSGARGPGRRRKIDVPVNVLATMDRQAFEKLVVLGGDAPRSSIVREVVACALAAIDPMEILRKCAEISGRGDRRAHVKVGVWMEADHRDRLLSIGGARRLSIVIQACIELVDALPSSTDAPLALSLDPYYPAGYAEWAAAHPKGAAALGSKAPRRSPKRRKTQAEGKG